jgi:hypothetical protein
MSLICIVPAKLISSIAAECYGHVLVAKPAEQIGGQNGGIPRGSSRLSVTRKNIQQGGGIKDPLR